MGYQFIKPEIILGNFKIDNLCNAYFVIDYNVDKYYHLSSKINQQNTLVIKSSEKIKSFSGIHKILQFFINNNLNRSSYVVAVGGGTLLDLVGFCASIFKRGINLYYVPTTLLSMADAAFGGKNGINYRNIKNIIGTYYFPNTIQIDIKFLLSLSKKYILSGYFEILKISMIHSSDFFFFLLNNIDKLNDNNYLLNIINKSIDIKNNIIINDLYDNNQRKLLNFGHTIGHSIELEYNIPHGISVAYGIRYALKFSERYCGLNQSISDIYDYHLKKLRINLNRNFQLQKILKNIKSDKKSRGNTLDIILLEDIGKPVIYNINYEQFISDLQNLLEP